MSCGVGVAVFIVDDVYIYFVHDRSGGLVAAMVAGFYGWRSVAAGVAGCCLGCYFGVLRLWCWCWEWWFR